MPYILKNSNGTVLATIADGSIDNTTTPLTFVGKNYSGYGQILDQNLLYLLQNFSNTSAPFNAIQGQLWFDSKNIRLNTYDGQNYRQLPFISTATTQPSNAHTGDFWLSPTPSPGQLKVYNGTEFISIAAATSAISSSTSNLITVKDSSDVNHYVVEHQVNGSTSFVDSYDGFDVSSSDPLFGFFSRIKPGITLPAANYTSGVSAVNANSGYLLWGTAADSLQSQTLSTDAGTAFYAAATSNLASTIVARDAGSNIRSTNFIGTSFSGNNFTGISFVGNSFFGTATQSNTLLVGAAYLSAATSATANTIVARDNFGQITAANFLGTASQANLLLSNGIFQPASATAIANSIAARDSNGSIVGNTFIGTATLANSMLADGTVYSTATSSAIPNTIVVRDSLGDIYATTFHGNISGGAGTSAFATTATYALQLRTARTINGTAFDGTANITFNSDAVAEGSTNLYFTPSRAQSAISLSSGGTFATYSGGVLTLAPTTTNVTEGTNLYYTDARARLSLGFASGSGAYNNSTGVITIPTDNSQIGNGAGYITSVGTVSQANTLQIDGSAYAGATTAATASRVVARNSSGDVYAVIFHGTATSAYYADLAECYLADNMYDAGTVVEFGGEFEVTLASEATPRVAGIISTNPAHLMNASLSGQFVAPVALTGRVPCKVIGQIKKGDLMISAGNGYARAEHMPVMGSVIGKALENFNGPEGVIEVVVGRI